MEKIRINQLANNQVELYTNSEIRFYSYSTCICVYSYKTKEFILSENEAHFTRTTVKWLNRFLTGYDTTYQDIKKTAIRKNLN